MAHNAWVNSYLKAILEVGREPLTHAAGAKNNADGSGKDSLMLRERGHFSPAQYFVKEVIGFSESDLYKSWVLAAATRNSQERNTRLENLSWRIWHVARQKNQIKFREAMYQLKRREEMELSLKKTVQIFSKEPDDGGKYAPDHVGKDSNIGDDSDHSSLEMSLSSDVIGNKLYIVLISIHGLIRGKDMELGCDSDSGGQVKYVVELAKALASSPGVYRVDLLTRQVFDPKVDQTYSMPSELLTPRTEDSPSHEVGPSSGAWITRIPFGPKKYIWKEDFWLHIQEFVDNALHYIKDISANLGTEINKGSPLWPVAIHGHYADAGDCAALLSAALNLPMLFTGHSLGRDKLAQLINLGRQRDEINKQYRILRRIEAEELALDSSEMIITSTRQEIEEQWNSYDAFDVTIANTLEHELKRGINRHGRFAPHMVIIPPGMEFDHVIISDDMVEEEHKNIPDIWKKIMRFLENPRKPIILALARPDPKKNVPLLVKAFGENDQLRELANLVLIMGNRTDIGLLTPASDSYVTSILRLIDKYDLYGQVAYPKQHRQSEVSDIYHLVRKTKGVFINPALIEPFGLTLIEAAAHGVPVVATKNGGPVDILRELEHGVLIDPNNEKEISDALYSILSNKELWKTYHDNALKNKHKFSWTGHCKKYISEIANLTPRKRKLQSSEGADDKVGDGIVSQPIKDDQSKFQNDRSDDNENPNVESMVLRRLNLAVADLRCKSYDLSIMKRDGLLVVAVDSVTAENHSAIIKGVLEASHNEKEAKRIGVVIATFLTLPELHSLLISANISPIDFDCFMCNSGSDIFYPFLTKVSPPEFIYIRDDNYNSQYNFHWGGKWLKEALLSWNPLKEETGERVVTEDEERSSSYCVALRIVNQKIPPTRELRKEMRRQALRCHVVYSHDGTKINVIPILASRSQSLRYLYMKWGIELSKMAVIVGESGDSDHEGLLGGLHKTIVLQGSFNIPPSEKSAARTYSVDEFVAQCPMFAIKIEGYKSADIKSALQILNFFQ